MLTVNKVLTSIGLKFNYIPDIWAIKLVCYERERGGEGVKYNNCFYLLSVCHRIIKQIVEVPKCQIVDVRLAGNSLQVYKLLIHFHYNNYYSLFLPLV